MPTDGEQEESLRRMLASLAVAADLPIPTLVVVADRLRLKDPAHVDSDPDEAPRIKVTERLLTSSSDEQEWRLAACLAWWASPVPRRRARQGLAVAGAALVPHAVFGFGQLGHMWHLPKPVLVAVGALVGVVLLLGQLFAARYAQRGLEEGALDVLRSAGRDPAVVARQAFGGRKDPAWFRRPLTAEPTPSQRIAAAERLQVQADRPLF